jgi:hypothetical protein
VPSAFYQTGLALHECTYARGNAGCVRNVLGLVRINTQTVSKFWQGIHKKTLIYPLASNNHLSKILVDPFFSMKSYSGEVRVCFPMYDTHVISTFRAACSLIHSTHTHTHPERGRSVPYRRTKIDGQIYPRKSPASPVYSFIWNIYLSGDDWRRWCLHIDADGQIH